MIQVVSSICAIVLSINDYHLKHLSVIVSRHSRHVPLPMFKPECKMEIRTYCNLSLSNGDACATSAFPPNSLLSHLKSMGGGIQPKNEGKAKTPVKCYMHYATRVYLTKLFKDYYDGGK